MNKDINRLYYGDCLSIMANMPPGSVDLIYLDPPFNSAKDYNAIYKDEIGRPLPDQIEAFRDTWQFDQERQRSLNKMPKLMLKAGIGGDVVEFWRLWISALRPIDPALLSYLVYMTERLLPMRRILKSTGSVYLHCDTTAGHYIKIIMDVVFGHKNFINEIIWHYQTGGASKRWFSKKHDNIFLYSCGKDYTFNANAVQVPRTTKALERAKNPRGARISADNDTKTAMDVWTDIQALNPMAKERLNYATQKPVSLLERIICASSNKGDLVLDPFCGCATTIEAANNLNRRWIGIDIAIHAIKRVAAVRLRDRLGLKEGLDYLIEGIPRNMEGARDLAKRDKYHFQKWAVEQVEGFVTSKRTADGGIDGRIYFVASAADKNLSSMVVEVKAGKNVSRETVRSLRGVLERERVAMAGLITLEPLGERKLQGFKQEMAQAGDLVINGHPFARMQLLTAQEILDGAKFDLPGGERGRGATEPVLL